MGKLGPCGRILVRRPRRHPSLAAAIRLQLGLTANIWPLAEPSTAASPGGRVWARLIARIFDAAPLRCRGCDGPRQLIAFIAQRTVIARIFDHIGEPSRAPHMAPIRSPSEADAMQQRENLWTLRSQHPDPPADLMPD